MPANVEQRAAIRLDRLLRREFKSRCVPVVAACWPDAYCPIISTCCSVPSINNERTQLPRRALSHGKKVLEVSSSVKPIARDRYFVPAPDEITAHDLPVTGALPTHLSGLYLRNGPNPRVGSAAHFMIGDGMVHGIRLKAGLARWYRNRYVKTRREAGIRGGASSNTHVFAHAGRVLSFVEAALPMEINRLLDTIGPVDFGGVDTAFTAHGKIDPGTGELLGFGYQFAKPHLTFYRIDRTGQLIEHRAIELSTPCYMHDFAMTDHYVIFFDTPAVMVQEWGGGLPFRWQEGRGTRIGVVPRRGGPARWFDVPACQLLHTANAFEVDGRIVVDGTRCDRFPPDVTVPPTALYRWEIDLERGNVTEAAMGHHPVELPRVDERRNGRPYRYAYVVEFRDFGPASIPQGSLLRRYDVETGASVANDFGVRYAPGEPVFVPKAADAAENDGWVMALRYDREQDLSDLIVLDAHEFGGDPVAIVHLPRRVPFGFHGSWVAD
jgi:carotenoid cleavage dioxygenase-like enzyme